MAQCPLEIPQCKRKIMTCDEPFKSKQCPLNVRPQCALLPPACPLVPQRDNECAISKLQGNKGDVSQCPCKSPCILASPGCPISLNPPTKEPKEDNRTFPDYVPSCPIGNCVKKPNNAEVRNHTDAPNRDLVNDVVKQTSNAPASSRKNKCPVGSNRRPLPCAECILGELASDGERKPRTCPFIKMADMCGPQCKCEEVPDVDSGPRCPFLPKPCPCCSTPRCPMTKEVDCPLKPLPPCRALTPPCVCGKNCLGETVVMPSCPPPPKDPPRCLCGGCPGVVSPCPLVAPKCVCGACPLLFPCCPPRPSCFCGMCPIGKILCAVSGKCPPNPVQSCPLNSGPQCPLTSPPCPLNDPCPLLKKPMCPPIPTPCSVNNYELKLNPPVTTFHVPICPEYKPPCEKHLAGDGELICPFSPHPCPLGATCPFPVANPKKGKDNLPSKIAVPSNVSIPTSNQVKPDTCPGSKKCGALPHPTCPAAEIIYPNKYKKPVKPKKEECPLKECMRTPECPLSKAMPNVDCPMAEGSDCPLSKEPDCPVRELASRCPLTSNCLPSGCPIGNEPTKQKNQPMKALGNTSECPFSSLPDCLKGALAPKPGCPLSPKVDCPLAGPPECPLAPPPPCPLSEFAPKSNCPLASTACPLTSTSNCPLSAQCPLPQNVNKKQAPNQEKSYCVLSQITSENNTKLDGTASEKKHLPIKSMPPNSEKPTRECPLSDLMPKQNCPLAPPPCPFTPKPKCPLTKKPDPCPLSFDKPNCPVEYPPCKKFPEGRCPMGPLNICDCDYPVCPCMAPLQDETVVAPPQFCYKENCCMGLGLPPVKPAEENTVQAGDGYYYRFMDSKPGREETKHYVEVLDEPPEMEISLFGRPRKRLHDNWTVVKYGEGFKRCKTIARVLKELGPATNRSAQYLEEDCLLDPLSIALNEARKQRIREMNQIEEKKKELARGMYFE